MDYDSFHGKDIASFDLRDTHRLPTVAASQALEEFEKDPLPTGLDRLDRALSSGHRGGFKRGQVTEVWGPPGAGKTAFAIQTAAHAICSGHDVAWVGRSRLLAAILRPLLEAKHAAFIDCFHKLHEERITRVVESVERRRLQDGSALPRGKFTLLSCLTLPHLMALISRPTPRLIGSRVCLIVISSPSALIDSALPKSQDPVPGSKPAGRGFGASAKRSQGLQFVMGALEKLAATRKCAVVMLSQCATRMQSEQGATLVTAVNNLVWDQGVTTRLVLFRDWAWQGGKLSSVFMAGLQKLDGQATTDAIDPVFTFSIGADGVTEHVTSSLPDRPADFSVPSRKRKLGQAELEVPDSDDDDDDDGAYGWAAEDEAALPAPPPQWQGSEDILLGPSGSSDGESPR
ncbi:hypothetical protein L249_3756 [Ophiocordyceps polyrhachis-furcata BCC 54312]|uniref:RecA family profile 1 domain-containing protein n=1 Tax=Ophiocordyceps polyrhachis-furcata BCC 54312 TaxID=1330021 RepID=A0A367L4R8_9HYPO|nr:hypothetical protein L249_3756 [Ophiocordyceps polyrhachis-furcata BCC 54312]